MVRKRARERFAEGGIGAEDQTRIALFLQAVKGFNAAVLAKAEFQPLEWLPYRFLHSQCFKEMELSTLLARATTWSLEPFVYLQATQLNLALWEELNAPRYLQGVIEVDQTFYEYLALSHAFMSDIRFLPLIPAGVPLDTPFLSALKEIEEENGRQIQTQIRLLKDMRIDMSPEDKERLIEMQQGKVRRLFDRLLAELSEYGSSDKTASS